MNVGSVVQEHLDADKGKIADVSEAQKCYSPEEAYMEKEECQLDKYYAGIDLTSSDALHNKLKGHRVLLYGTQAEDDPEFLCADVWKAMDFLDENKGNSSKVDLIYSKHPVDKTWRKMDSYWNREHVWPKSYGVSCKYKEKKWSCTRRGLKCRKKKPYVETNGPFTDLHHLFPSHSKVNGDRSSEYFNECTPRTCSYDHHEDDGYTAEDQDAGESLDDISFWQPPKKSRGVVARALFYMALRYDGEEENTLDLTLTDYPNPCHDSLGKLSVLKKWHKEFPPTEAEKERNSKACWMQGNRNPFVDHPELVDALFGENAKPNLVKQTFAGSCDAQRPRAKMCNPDAGWVDLCTGDGPDPPCSNR
jgi:endonuclease I